MTFSIIPTPSFAKELKQLAKNILLLKVILLL